MTLPARAIRRATSGGPPAGGVLTKRMDAGRSPRFRGGVYLPGPPLRARLGWPRPTGELVEDAAGRAGLHVDQRIEAVARVAAMLGEPCVRGYPSRRPEPGPAVACQRTVNLSSCKYLEQTDSLPLRIWARRFGRIDHEAVRFAARHRRRGPRDGRLPDEDAAHRPGRTTSGSGRIEQGHRGSVLDDAHDEGTFTLGLMNASGARLEATEATGTLENRVMAAAWLASHLSVKQAAVPPPVRLGHELTTNRRDAVRRR